MSTMTTTTATTSCLSRVGHAQVYLIGLNESFESNINYLLTLNYLYLIPGFSLLGLLVNFICFFVFYKLRAANALYKFLFASTIFNFATCLISLVYPFIIYITDLKIVGTYFAAFYEMYFLNFSLNISTTMSIVMVVGTLFERYTEIHKHKINYQSWLQERSFFIALGLALVIIVGFNIPVALQYQINQLPSQMPALFSAEGNGTANQVYSIYDMVKDKNDYFNYVKYHAILIKERMLCTSSTTSKLQNESNYQAQADAFYTIASSNFINDEIYNLYVLVLFVGEDLIISLLVPLVMMFALMISLRNRLKKKKKYFVTTLIRRNLFHMNFILNIAQNTQVLQGGETGTEEEEIPASTEPRRAPAVEPDESIKEVRSRDTRPDITEDGNTTHIELQDFFKKMAVMNTKDFVNENNMNDAFSYKKSNTDIIREKLIELVIVINVIVFVSKLPELISLILEKFIWSYWFENGADITSSNNLEQKLRYIRISVLFIIVSNSILYLSYSANMLVFLILDEKFRRSYESIFKHICYFKIHFPRKIKVTLYA